MKVTVNGTLLKKTGQANLLDLVLSFDVKPDDVVIVYNEIVVKRDVWASTLLADGDRVELVSLLDPEPLRRRT